MTRLRSKAVHRETQRLETRQRVFEAAVSEIKEHGFAGANIGAIASAVGIARGTFYFHFPTKEHVVVELLLHEERRIADELSEELDATVSINSALKLVADRLAAEEQRLGATLYRDLLSIYFVAPQLVRNDTNDHAVAVLVIEQIERARRRGEIYSEVNSANSAKFFLLGLYALLITNGDPSPTRDGVVDDYLAIFCRGLESH